jgi:hypothetical protein
LEGPAERRVVFVKGGGLSIGDDLLRLLAEVRKDFIFWEVLWDSGFAEEVLELGFVNGRIVGSHSS